MKIKSLILLCVVSFSFAVPAHALYFVDGDGSGFGAAQTSSGGTFTLASAASQVFASGAAVTAISPITVTQVFAATPISAVKDIRITIPEGFGMRWDADDLTAGIAGTGSAGTTVSYEDSGRTLVVDVTSDFADGQYITISGLSFKNFSTASSPNSLGLELDNAGSIVALDEADISVTVSNISGIFADGNGSGLGFYPGPWRGIHGGVTNPASINGIPVWNIYSISGVTN